MRFSSRLDAIFGRIVDTLNYLGIFLLVFITLAVIAEVVVRYGMGYSITWVVDIGEYIMLWIAFLGGAWVLKREGHVRMDLVINCLKPRTQTLVNLAMSFVGVGICLILCWYSGESTLDHFLRGVTRRGMIRVPKAPIMAVIPIGSLLLAIQFLKRALGFLRDWKSLR